MLLLRLLRALLLVVAIGFVNQTANAQPSGPQAWWPIQPRPLPFLHPLFSDEMVLQREIHAPMWGWSTSGDKVTVTLNAETPDAKSLGSAVVGADGKWMLKLTPQRAGGPHSLTVERTPAEASKAAEKVTLRNVLFGDVWLCTGQSNMNWPVRLSTNGEEEAKQSNNPEIRSFTVSFYPSLLPEKLPPPAKWEPCTPEFTRNFSGVGYFFAREIQKTQKIPIGIIHSSAGATAAESWVSPEALRRVMPHDFKDRLDEREQLLSGFGPDFEFFRAMERWTASVDPVSAEKRYVSDPDLKTDDWLDISVPKAWEETGIESLKDFDGFVWFRHTFDVPEAWTGKDLVFDLSIINDIDVVWLNGTMIGSKQMPGIRSYTVDKQLVKPGKNLLIAAVLNQKGPGGFCSGPSNMAIKMAKNQSSERLKLAGTWKAKPVVSIADLKHPAPSPALTHYKMISAQYNGIMAPLVPYGIKGALWYQGEANGPFWLQYRRLLPTLIDDWRARFEVGDFPFLIVSLANLNQLQTLPVEPGWAEIRESQWRTVRKVPNTGLAMTIDIGDPKDIHPRNKQEVGRRLSLVARNLVYGEKDVIYSGPEFSEMQVELPKGDKIRLYFKHVHGGLMIKPGDEKLTGFIVAGADKNWVWADAVIEGDTIVVSSPEVPLPKYVRYGWAWNPKVNLFNKEGLPAITFRTDE